MTEVYRIKCGFVNCYLLRENGRSILVDAGNPGDKDRIIRLVSRYGVAPGHLELVLLTHNHADHIGAAAYYQARRIPVAMHPADLPLPGMLKSKGVLGRLLLAASLPSLRAQQPFHADVLLEDGGDLAEYGITGTVLALPGHTPGSVGVLLEEGRLICGDTFMNLAGPRTAPIAEDFDALARTAALLRERGVERVYPSHGKPFSLKK